MAFAYDHPINVVEKDNKKILQYELIGLNESHIEVKKEWVNKTRELFLVVVGKFTDEITGWENEINIREKIDWRIYDNIDWVIKDGILTVFLDEILHDQPFVSLNKVL